MGAEGAVDMMAAQEWPGMAPDLVLLSPAQCRQLWRQFSSDSSYIVQQAQATQACFAESSSIRSSPV